MIYQAISHLRGSPLTGLHFGPEKDFIPGSLLKKARYKIVLCVLQGIDGSARKPALRQDTDYMVLKKLP